MLKNNHFFPFSYILFAENSFVYLFQAHGGYVRSEQGRQSGQAGVHDHVVLHVRVTYQSSVGGGFNIYQKRFRASRTKHNSTSQINFELGAKYEL